MGFMIPMLPAEGDGYATYYSYDAPLEDGDREGVILTADAHKSKTGNPCLKLGLGFDGPEGGVRIDHYVILTQGQWSYANLIKVFAGLAGPTGINSDALRGERVLCKIKQEEDTYNGGWRAKIKTLLKHVQQEAAPRYDEAEARMPFPPPDSEVPW
jgi:hypothetical protein